MNSQTIKEKKLRKYNLCAHRIYIVFWIIFIALLAAFGIPWVIGLIGFIFRKIPGWGDPNASSGLVLSLDMLPSFLGGLVGILAGFILEGVFFEQLRHLKKYEAYCVSLKCTFDSMQEVCKKVEEEKQLYEINKLLFEDIMTSVENDALFYNLPRYLFFEVKIRGKKYNVKGNIHKKLHDINRVINNIENQLTEYENTIAGSKESKNIKVCIMKLYEELSSCIDDFRKLTNLKDSATISKTNSTEK